MLTIAVLYGGSSSEREVSLKSGQAVIEALNPMKYNVVPLDPSVDLARLVELAPSLDVALIMLHGRGGEDGAIQGMLDLLNVPYQCSGVLGCAIAMNKAISKDIYKYNSIPIADGILLERAQEKEVMSLLPAKIDWPVVVKPASEGSSFGVSIVKCENELLSALEKAFALDSQVLIEEFLDGVELTVGVLGNHDPEPLPVIEIIPPADTFFDFDAKYVAGKSQEICPARISEGDSKLVRDFAVKAHSILQLRGYSRSDFILTKNKGPIILETNTVPGMTKNSLLPLAARTAGFSFEQLADKLVELALENKRP